jgi:APA family basic amino acid/polyamine antiporter
MGAPRRVLSLFDSVALVVGLVVGAGIFRLPSLVAAELDSETLVLAAWLAGGLLSLIGALCFAELATAFPHPGGEYHFLTRAYGRGCGFMFGWARVTVVQTGSIALLAYVFGDYASELLPLGPQGPAIYAAASVVVLTGVNLLGIRQTSSLQNFLFATTLLGLACIVVAGLAPATPEAADIPPARPAAAMADAVGLAMVFVLLTYGGWNEAAYLSAEVKGGRRNMLRMLVISVALITVIYVAANAAYLRVLGLEGVAESPAVASELMRIALGSTGAHFITAMILLVVLASINVTTLTGARTTFALGRDFPALGFLARWSDRGGAPVPALLLQGAIVLALVLLGSIDRRGVETLIDYLSPVFWLFFLLTGVSLFVLRRRWPDAERAFRVPFYPVTPLLFCLASAYLLYASLRYTGDGALVGVAVMLAGFPAYLWARRRAHDTASERPEQLAKGPYG